MFRERILGENHPMLIQAIIIFGGVFGEAQHCAPCLLIFNHAMQIAIHNKIPIHNDILRFTKVILYVSKTQIIINYN